MTDIDRLLARQAAWQRARRDLPWAEKVRLAEALRDLAQRWKRERSVRPSTGARDTARISPRRRPRG